LGYPQGLSAWPRLFAILAGVSRKPRIPAELTSGPFRGSKAIASGSITKAMLAGERWQRLFPDVYAYRGAQLDHRAWCVAAMLVLPAQTAIGGLSAAYLWGVTEAPGSVTVAAPRNRRLPRKKYLSVHYTTLADTDTTELGGLRVTTPERTVFDLGRRIDRAEALGIIDAMLHRHLLNPVALHTMIHERGAWPRTPTLARLLPLADPRSESPMETRLRLLLADSGIPPSATQFEVVDTAGVLLGRLDLAWPEVRLGVEYDGDHHRDREQFRRDMDRLNRLRMAGWTVLRFTAEDVLRRPAETARMVLFALATAGRT
jgi:hypothetical protein